MYRKMPNEVITNDLVKPLTKLEEITINDINKVLEKRFGISYNVI